MFRNRFEVSPTMRTQGFLSGKHTQSAFNDSRPSQRTLDSKNPLRMRDSRPVVSGRQSVAQSDNLPQQYQDILSSADKQMRMSCPREIKADPSDIDNSVIISKKDTKRYIHQPGFAGTRYAYN